MKLFVSLSIHPYRRQTFPLLKSFFSKSGCLKRNEVEVQGLEALVFVEKLEDCDWVVLPMSWNFYQQNNQVGTVISVIKQAKKCHKKVLSFTSGDYGVMIPEFDNLIILRASGNRSKLSANHQGIPAFIEDPIQNHFSEEGFTLQPYTKKPKIGFCGMANTSRVYAFEELGRISRRNLKYYLGVNKYLPQDLLPTTYRRAQLLMELKKSPLVEDQFIFRKKYQAGAQTKEEKKHATLEFYQNIKDSQYVLCFRGAGNFSVRLYETLAMGRIPIFVNTDCLIPLREQIEWKKHMVWVEYGERDSLLEKVLDFHQGHDDNSFIKLQKNNRKLWEDALTLKGFFKRFLFLTL